MSKLSALVLIPVLLAAGCGGGGGSTTTTMPPGGGNGGITCTAESVSLAEQLQNPVTLFPKDNNGIILELPSVPANGAMDPSPAAVVFGIGTEANNGLGGATRLNGNLDTGDLTASFTGNPSITLAFIDSGSNANFFPYSAASLPTCANPDQGFYCPTTIQHEDATLNGTLPVSFYVDNAVDLFNANKSFTAFNDIAGPGTDNTQLILGMPYFFGQNVFTGIEPADQSAPPYFAVGGSTPFAASGSNVQTVSVDAGPPGLSSPAANTPFISVTICVPGTNDCQTIDHVEVDTGSVGLRLIASVVTLSLPVSKDASNNPLAECLQFADGTSWGSVGTADLTISGESAKGVNVQLIGASAAGSPPAACKGMAENSVDTFGANGIIGVGPFTNDCNTTGDCTPGIQSANYYYCTGS